VSLDIQEVQKPNSENHSELQPISLARASSCFKLENSDKLGDADVIR